MALASEFKLPILEDAAEALGSSLTSGSNLSAADLERVVHHIRAACTAR